MLKHHLQHDPSRSHLYVLNFLLQFYSNDQIVHFGDSSLRGLI